MDMGLTEETNIDVGDFLALYTGTFNSSEGTVVYGEVTNVTENDGSETVSFVATTERRCKKFWTTIPKMMSMEMPCLAISTLQ
jgi:hypothetical protein